MSPPLDRQLTPISKEYRTKRVALASKGLAELARFNPSELNQVQRVSAAMLAWQLDSIVRSEKFEEYRLVFQQFSGLQVQLVNFLTQTHPIRNRRDIQNYLVRLELVAGEMDEGISQAKERAAHGFLPPDFIIASTLAQFDRFLSGTPRENVLVSSLIERSTRLKSITSEDEEKFAAAAEKTVGESVIPAFRRARALLQDQSALAKPETGLSRFPGGEDAYADALRRSTTTKMSALEIHQLGLKEVSRIEEDMDGLLRQLGYREGTVKERWKNSKTTLSRRLTLIRARR